MFTFRIIILITTATLLVFTCNKFGEKKLRDDVQLLRECHLIHMALQKAVTVYKLISFHERIDLIHYTTKYYRSTTQVVIGHNQQML
jgi:hypothetical protein